MNATLAPPEATPLPPARSGSAIPRAVFWSGIGLSVFASLFLTFDLFLKLSGNPMAVQGTVKLGYPASMLLPLGLIELFALALYWIPRTRVLGALIWTGYLGGAVATHVRLGDPLFTHVLFPVYVATLLWLGLWLRDRRVRAVLPISDAAVR